MKNFLFCSALILSVLSCKHESKTDAGPGAQIQVVSEGLSYNEVTVSVNDEKSELKVFNYGDKITLNFVNAEGFERVGGKIYPGLSLIVLNKQKDTLLYYEDMYEDKPGIGMDPVTLTADLVAANPILSGEIVTARLDFWDKKGKGKMRVNFQFSTKSNDNLEIKTKRLSYREIYIFSEKDQRVISDNRYDKADDMLYFIMEGLEGFKEQDGMVFPCLMLEVTDENGETVLKEENIFADYFETGATPEDVGQKIYFGLSRKVLGKGSKLKIHAVLVDKISDASLILDTEIMPEKDSGS